MEPLSEAMAEVWLSENRYLQFCIPFLCPVRLASWNSTVLWPIVFRQYCPGSSPKRSMLGQGQGYLNWQAGSAKGMHHWCENNYRIYDASVLFNWILVTLKLQHKAHIDKPWVVLLYVMSLTSTQTDKNASHSINNAPLSQVEQH